MVNTQGAISLCAHARQPQNRPLLYHYRRPMISSEAVRHCSALEEAKDGNVIVDVDRSGMRARRCCESVALHLPYDLSGIGKFSPAAHSSAGSKHSRFGEAHPQPQQYWGFLF